MNAGDINRLSTAPGHTVGARKRMAMLKWGSYCVVAWVVLLLLIRQFAVLDEAQAIFVQTLWWSVGALIATILSIDRFIHVPAAQGGIWVVFSSATCFASLLVLLAATHAAYSRVALAGSFVVVTVWLFVGMRRHLRTLVLKLGVPEPAVLALLEDARDVLHSVQLTHVRAELIASQEIDALIRLDGVVIDRYSAKSEGLQRIITRLKLGGTRIYSADHIHELLTGRLALSHTEDSFLDDSSGRIIYEVLKRVLDLLGAVVLLVVLAVPMTVIAIALRLEGPGSRALFLQERVGRSGKAFRMVKFRTMRPARTMSERPASSVIEQHDESRVTTIGRFLRRYRLDELPQLFNVLAGTMSLIGPRPEWVASASDFFDRIPHYPYRHLVRPGITGWAQVTQGHVTDLSDAMVKLELDLFYVKHMSFALDLVIGVRTVRTVLTGYGSR